jgi:hypothetical protein
MDGWMDGWMDGYLKAKLLNWRPLIYFKTGGSSVSIVSDYRLDDRGSISGIGKDFSSSLCVETGSEVHPAF